MKTNENLRLNVEVENLDGSLKIRTVVLPKPDSPDDPLQALGSLQGKSRDC